MYNRNYETYQTAIPYNNMMYQNDNNIQYSNSNDDRFLGGFAFPFLLGGVTGAALAPAFYRPYPYYGGYNRPYYPSYPCYGPYCWR